MNRIIFTNTDGSIGILIPAKGISLDRLVKDVPAGLAYEIVDETDIPADRAFRNAWVHDKTNNPQKVSVNVALGRDISLARVRANRDAALAVIENGELKELTRKGLDLTEVNAKIQVLLDATEALKALDVNTDGIISVEEAAGKLLPLELVA